MKRRTMLMIGLIMSIIPLVWITTIRPLSNWSMPIIIPVIIFGLLMVVYAIINPKMDEVHQ
ncbi:hypothetical protein LCGC14_2911990 [marine sediment metagenome]|uniref:Uncharacterized protein n=1 Tax=marine sediment metagenome TaxID=412755 RepID=A0A0F8ZZ00_9ZZZZ